jgi:pyroglutamyl-peptidase
VRPIILVTGFGPFPGAPRNPSQTLVAALRHAAESERDYDLHTSVLPTRYDAAREAVLRLHRRLKPDIALHFGFSLKAKGFTLERLAENWLASGRLDAGGGRPARPVIREAGPLVRPSTLPIERIHAALEERGLPVAFSADAGGYVCNLVFYAAAASGRGARPAMAGFVHIPLIAEMPVAPAQRARAARGLAALAQAELVDGARSIVQTCINEWRRSQAPAGSEEEPAPSRPD